MRHGIYSGVYCELTDFRVTSQYGMFASFVSRVTMRASPCSEGNPYGCTTTIHAQIQRKYCGLKKYQLSNAAVSRDSQCMIMKPYACKLQRLSAGKAATSHEAHHSTRSLDYTSIFADIRTGRCFVRRQTHKASMQHASGRFHQDTMTPWYVQIRAR